jgi:DNA-binding transcriptional LysR family regulator
MNLRHLGYFVALAREGHFGRAAQAAHVAQPTLSAAIRQLEDELDVPLVVRTRQRFEGLTPEGREVLVWAQRMLAESESLQQYLAELKGVLKGHLRIGVIPTAEPIIAHLTHALQQRYPGISVTLISSTSREIERALADHDLDAGVSYAEGAESETVRAVPLYLERYFVAGVAKLLPARRASLTWREAAALPLCLLSRDMQNRRILDRHFDEAGVVPAVVAEANTLIGVLSHIDTGAWCGILPAAMFGFLRGVKALPLVEPEVSHRIALLVPQRTPVPPLTRALLTVAMALKLEAVVKPLSR